MKQTRKWIRLLIWLIALAVFLIPASALADSGGDNCTNAAIVFIAVPLGLTPAVVIVIIINDPRVRSIFFAQTLCRSLFTGVIVHKQ